MHLARRVAVLTLSLGLCAPAFAQYVPLSERLSAQDFQQAGLHRLSAAELAHLDALLQGAMADVRERERDRTRAEAPARERIQARLVGRFDGWTRGEVLTLDNGQRWQVLEGEFRPTRAIDAPAVTLNPGLMSGWYLQVQGQSPRAKVKRLD